LGCVGKAAAVARTCDCVVRTLVSAGTTAFDASAN
jgi:hypothetical protein